MEKSQLRKLALHYSRKGISRSAYRKTRHALIDDITEGRSDIVRSADDFVPEAKGERSQRAMHLVVGSAVLIGLALAIWTIFGPNDGQPRLQRPAPTQQVSRTRALLERFVAMHDFSETGLREFERDWTQLQSEERDHALQASWFHSFERALRLELDAQRALSAVDLSGRASAKAYRLFEFGRTVGIAARLPVVRTPAISEPASTDRSVADAQAADVDSAQLQLPALSARRETSIDQTPNGNDTVAATSAPEQSQDLAPETPANPNTDTLPDTATETAAATPEQILIQGREWLARQDASAYTLQLVTVKRVAPLLAIVEGYPNTDLHIVASSGAETRYRLLSGIYPTPASAQQSASSLPGALQTALGQPFARRIGLLKPQSTIVSAPPAQTAEATPPKSAQGAYTLQLLASSKLENAKSFVARHPALGLEIREVSNSPAPYRVIHGRYQTLRLANNAAKTMPESVFKEAGTPLAKAIATFASP